MQALSMANLIDQLGMKEIDLLKIDIEGYETVLFTGDLAWLSLVYQLIMKDHDMNFLIPLEGLLQDANFDVLIISTYEKDALLFAKQSLR